MHHGGSGRQVRATLVTAIALLFGFALNGSPSVTNVGWVMATGDDPGRAHVAFNDSDWQRADPLASWRDARLATWDGFAWYRGTVALSPEARLAADRDDLGLLLGPPAYGGYQVFANGKPLGRSRGWDDELAFQFAEVFRVPRDAVAPDGTVHLALRVRRIGWASDASGRPTGGVLQLGGYAALSDRMRARWADTLRSELSLLLLSAIFVFVFLHQIMVYLRRRTQREHLWFGLLALAFALNTFSSTFWVYELTTSGGVATRWSDATGHLASALAIQFLWSFFGIRISRALRAYQMSHVALALFVAWWPGLRLIFVSSTVRWLWLLPLLVLAALLVLRQAWRGDADARVIAIGGAIMTAVEGVELARNAFGISLPIDVSLAPFGFAAVIIAMSLALSYRFRRVHDELDRLRFTHSDERHPRHRGAARTDIVVGRTAEATAHHSDQQPRSSHTAQRRHRLLANRVGESRRRASSL
jgi:hypothetical protein